MLKGSLIDGAADPAPEQWGKTTEEEQLESGSGGWPGVTANIKPPNVTLRLYGGAAFERVMHEFRFATYSIECPPVSREKVTLLINSYSSCLGSELLIFHLFNRLQIYYLLMLAEVEVGDLLMQLQRLPVLLPGHGLPLFLTPHAIDLLSY